jgi:hypothetical protein
MYGLGPVPFSDEAAVTSMDKSAEYEVILLTSEEPKVRASGGWDFPKDLGPDGIGPG